MGLNAATHLRFASVEEGRAVLGNADAFSAALSAFDRSARTNAAHSVSAEAFLRFASDQAQDWTDAEMRRLNGQADLLHKDLRAIAQEWLSRTLP